MIRHMPSLIANERGSELVRRLPLRPITGAEVGVHAGALSAYLLQARPFLMLHMIDSWASAAEQPEAYRATPDGCANLSLTEQLRFMIHATRQTQFARDRRRIHVMTSLEAAQRLRDLDFVFLDGDHSEEGITADLAAWLPALRPKGLLGGHDYGDPNFPGVQRAVERAAREHGWVIETGSDHTWFVRFGRDL